MRKLLVVLLSVLLASCASTDNIPTVTVTGTASVVMLPDMLSFTVTASNTADSTEEARAKTAAMVDSVLSILKDEYSVADDDIVTSYISISPAYSWQDGESILLGQRAVESLDITLHDLDKAGDILGSLSRLDGIEISAISADKEDKSAETMKARSLAVQDAYDKASVYANAAGYAIGDLVSLSDSVASSPYYRTYALAESSADGGSLAYYAGNIEIQDSVTAVYNLIK